jgi:hypothetical protein
MPMVEMLLSSNLPKDQLEQYAAQLATSLTQPSGRAAIGTMATTGLPAQAGNDSDPASLRTKALEAHNRFIQSGSLDQAARDDEQKYWAQAREAERTRK